MLVFLVTHAGNLGGERRRGFCTFGRVVFVPLLMIQHLCMLPCLCSAFASSAFGYRFRQPYCAGTFGLGSYSLCPPITGYGLCDPHRVFVACVHAHVCTSSPVNVPNFTIYSGTVPCPPWPLDVLCAPATIPHLRPRGMVGTNQLKTAWCLKGMKTSVMPAVGGSRPTPAQSGRRLPSCGTYLRTGISAFRRQ